MGRPARFRSPCAICHKMIEKGDDFNFHPKKRSAHNACVVKALSTNPAGQDHGWVYPTTVFQTGKTPMPQPREGKNADSLKEDWEKVFSNLPPVTRRSIKIPQEKNLSTERFFSEQFKGFREFVKSQGFSRTCLAFKGTITEQVFAEPGNPRESITIYRMRYHQPEIDYSFDGYMEVHAASGTNLTFYWLPLDIADGMRLLHAKMMNITPEIAEASLAANPLDLYADVYEAVLSLEEMP